MKNTMLGLALMALAAGRAGADDPAASLTRGKLEADLGHYPQAAAAFSAVVESPRASAEQRWEALVRLGQARRETGDLKGSADAFEEAWRTYGKDPEALRFLLQALGAALPGRERWDEVWSGVSIRFDRTAPSAPTVRVAWPGVEPSLCPCSGTPKVDFDFEDTSYNDVLRLVADVTGENIVVYPGVHGSITIDARQRPWDEVLEAMLAPNGYIAVHQGNVIWVSRPEDTPPRRTFTGQPIDFHFQGVALVQALRELAAHGGARVEVPEGVAGQVWLQLVDVPWDQSFHLLAHVNGLTWTRTGDVMRVAAREHSGTRPER